MLRYAAYVASLLLTSAVGVAGALAIRDWRWGAGRLRRARGAGHLGPAADASSTLRRNYPVLAHFRYGLESIGPEMRQYFIESDTDEVPFSRQQRALVYQRSKSVDRHAPVRHAARRVRRRLRMDQPFAGADAASNRTISASRSARERAQPYSASVFNISAMSFGSLSANAIRALNEGAQARRLLPRHRRGLDLAVPPRERRRPGVGDRLGLLRLPRRRRQLQRGALRRQRAHAAGAR